VSLATAAVRRGGSTPARQHGRRGGGRRVVGVRAAARLTVRRRLRRGPARVRETQAPAGGARGRAPVHAGAERRRALSPAQRRRTRRQAATIPIRRPRQVRAGWVPPANRRPISGRGPLQWEGFAEMEGFYYMIWDLHGWVQRDLPATDQNGESSSPDVPAGTGGTKV